MNQGLQNQIPPKTTPALVKVISILYYVSMGSLVIIAIGSFFVFEELNLAILISSVLIFLAALSFFIARGLWKGKNWARILVIIFAILNFIIGIMFLVKMDISNGITNLLPGGLIAGYLLFSTKVKEFFSKLN